MATSERLEDCEERLKSLLRELEGLISVTLPACTGEELRRQIQLTERRVKEAERLVDELQSEVNTAPRHYRQQYQVPVSQFKHQLSTIKRRLASHSTSVARDDLFSADDAYRGHSEYDQLLRNTDSLHRASESLYRAQQVSAETDQVGVEIIDNLHGQKQSLLRTKEKVKGFDGQMDRSRSLMRQIACQSIQNRVILICVIVVELIILAVLTWWKFFS